MIDPYGVSIAAGYVTAAFWGAAAGARRGLPKGDVLWWSVAAVVAGGITGRAAAVAGEWLLSPGHRPAEIGFPAGGVAYYPALAAGLVTLAVLARRRGVAPWRVADVGAPAFALAVAIGLIGWQPPDGFAAATGGPLSAGVLRGPVCLIALEFSIFWWLWRRPGAPPGAPTFEFLGLDAFARLASLWMGGVPGSSWMALGGGQWQHLAVGAVALLLRCGAAGRRGAPPVGREGQSGAPTIADACVLCAGITGCVLAFFLVAGLR